MREPKKHTVPGTFSCRRRRKAKKPYATCSYAEESLASQLQCCALSGPHLNWYSQLAAREPSCSAASSLNIKPVVEGSC